MIWVLRVKAESARDSPAPEANGRRSQSAQSGPRSIAEDRASSTNILESVQDPELSGSVTPYDSSHKQRVPSW